jgi:hypothetical protein
MPIGQLIGLRHLVDEAVEIAEIAIVVNQSRALAHVANVECLLTPVHALRKADAHFVKI